MKSLVVVLAIVTNAVLLDAQTATDCVSPVSDAGMSSLPAECQDSLVAVDDVLGNITRPNFTDIDFIIGNFCTMPQCVQPFVDYYICLGEIDFANVFDGFLCGEFNNQSCLQLWNNVFNLNDTNPDGISYVAVQQNCDNPLMCNEICSTELNKAVDLLGCCLAGIAEFDLCGPLESLRFEECSIQIPAICRGVADTPTTPAPDMPPTAGANCVHPVNDTTYPTQCELTAVENIAIALSAGDLANLDDVFPDDTGAVLNRFCTLECLGPLVDYYRCTGEPDFADAINGLLCGQDDTDYCLVTLPPKFALGPGSLLFTSFAILAQCNDVLACSSDCRDALNTVKDSLGCCLAGLVEFTVCGAFEQIRFDECGVDVGSACRGVDLTRRTELPPTTTTETVSGGIITVSFSLTLLSIVSIVIAKLS